jgi:tripartite-type tricarboxylate transporter receptor subunit TctC
VQGGKLTALAVTDGMPSPVAPYLPTVAGSGLPGFEAMQWFGILVPAGTPKEILARLHGEVVKALQQPDVRDRRQGLGMQIIGGDPERLGSFVRAETAKWGQGRPRFRRESGLTGRMPRHSVLMHDLRPDRR